MTTPLITIRNLSFDYGDKLLYKNVNMQFIRGHIAALMGGSGCGKTTLLRLIGGQLKPKQGEIHIADQNIVNLSVRDLYQIRRKMGMLFQFGALFRDMTVFENVAFPLREHTRLPESMIRDFVMMKLEAVGLRGANQLMPSNLSGGMLKRVALARAVALDPIIIMYDEPFAGLDPISSSVIKKLIIELNTALNAVSIIVTHDIQQAFSFVDYVYLLSSGRGIVAEGSPKTLQQSTDPLAKQFVHAEIDGTLPFHYPSNTNYRDDLLERR